MMSLSKKTIDLFSVFLVILLVGLSFWGGLSARKVTLVACVSHYERDWKGDLVGVMDWSCGAEVACMPGYEVLANNSGYMLKQGIPS